VIPLAGLAADPVVITSNDRLRDATAYMADWSWRGAATGHQRTTASTVI
jgi:hypothetical protein